MVFDHFARMLTRPNSGMHFGDKAWSPTKTMLLRSTDQNPGVDTTTQFPGLMIPDGSTGIGVDVAYGGRLLNNSLDRTKAYYETEYDYNVGSYYDKTLTIHMLTDSEDRFISESRDELSRRPLPKHQLRDAVPGRRAALAGQHAHRRRGTSRAGAWQRPTASPTSTLRARSSNRWAFAPGGPKTNRKCAGRPTAD